MKKKIIFITLAIFISFIFAVVIYTLIVNEPDHPVYITSDCTKKGFLCTKDELKKGVIVSFAVTPKETLDFFVISNTEEEMVLLSADVLGNKTSWNTENTNVKGPVTPLFELYDVTYNWRNVLTIKDYIYEDYGFKECLNSTNDELCKMGGYHNITFGTNTQVKTNIKLNDDEFYIYELGEYEFKSRLITVEEVIDLDIPDWLANNLKNGHGFWTMSSSTAANTEYFSGAYAIMKIEDKVRIESVPVSNELIGLKAVITVPKS